MKLEFFPESKVLMKPAKPVLEFNDTLRQLALDMLVYCTENNGVGLAAPQIGVPLQLFVVSYKQTTLIVSNPLILSRSGRYKCEEGCLSVPYFNASVTRAKEITLQGQTDNGESRVWHFTDPMVAKIIQHECDHLQGRLFYEYLIPRLQSHFQIPNPRKFRRWTVVDTLTSW